MPTSIMQKNYSHCPLKKRPVFIVKEGNCRLKNFSLRKLILLLAKNFLFWNFIFKKKTQTNKNYFVSTESDSEMEPENLSTKPEDLMLRTGKVPSLKVEKETKKAVEEIRLASPQPQET